MPVTVCVHQAVDQIRVFELVLAEREARAETAREVWRVRHGLHPARNDEARLTRSDLRRREHDRLQARPADLVDRRARDGVRYPCAKAGLPRRLLTHACLHHVSHEHFVDLFCLHACPLERAPDRDGPELRGGQRRQAAEEGADRSPGSAEDHCAHFASSRRFVTWCRYARISSRSAASSLRRSLTVTRCESSNSIRRGSTLALV